VDLGSKTQLGINEAKSNEATSFFHRSRMSVSIAYEIDHLFILTDVGSPGADLLIDLGLTEGPSNKHRGQGTACRRFYFRNTMLELLWIADPQETCQGVVRRLSLWDRWIGSQSGAHSPFGVCVRSRVATDPNPPFPTWSYCPPKIPDGCRIDIAVDSPLNEPLWFYLANGTLPDARAKQSSPPLTHRAGLCELTHLDIILPVTGNNSSTATRIEALGVADIHPGSEHLVAMTFDEGRSKQSTDFRPALPLILRW
jgi:hypothetical protein